MRIILDTYSTEEMAQVQMGYFPNEQRYRLIFDNIEEARDIKGILENLLMKKEEVGN